MKVTSVLAVAATMTVLAIAAPHAGFATPCQRSVSIVPQVSAGEGEGKLVFVVHSGGCPAAAEVGFEATSGTATEGFDFLLPDGQLAWVAGETAAKEISATILQDGKLEANLEDFAVELVDPGPDVIIDYADAQGGILDDDWPIPLGRIDDERCAPWLDTAGLVCPDEVMPWRPIVRPDVHFSKPRSTPVTLRWSTSDGTARAGFDYIAVVDQIQILAPGKTVVSLPVELLSPAPRPGSVYFKVHVSVLSSGVSIVDGEAVVTIDRS